MSPSRTAALHARATRSVAALTAACALGAASALGCSGGDDDTATPVAGHAAAGSSGGAGGGAAASGDGAGSGGSLATAGSGGLGGRSVSGGGGASGSTADAGGAGATSAGTDAGTITPDAGDATAQCTPCAGYAQPELLAHVQVAELDALSGIAAGVQNPEVLFAHGDRNSTTVYALALDGSLLARFALQGVTTVDLEDIAVARCPGGSCLYVADIGGNLAPRSEYAILRAPEPSVDASAPQGAERPLTVERFRFAYEDGAHNAEGILIDPGTGALYVVTKLAAGQASSVYRLPEPLDPTGLNTATKVATLAVPAAGDSPATATAAHPCGAGFLLRTNAELYEFRIARGAPFESAFGVQPEALAAGDEPQSEGVSYLADGSGFVTSGETSAAPIYRSRCR